MYRIDNLEKQEKSKKKVSLKSVDLKQQNKIGTWKPIIS